MTPIPSEASKTKQPRRSSPIFINGRISRRKPGRKSDLAPADQSYARARRRAGASYKTILRELEARIGKPVWCSTLERVFSRMPSLSRRRSVRKMLLAEKGKQRLDFARSILDIVELVSLPACERTIKVLERIRGQEHHRNQLARMVAWCARVGIALSRVENDESLDDPRLEIDPLRVAFVLNNRVIEAAKQVQLNFQRRMAAKGKKREY